MENLSDSALVFLDELPTVLNFSNDFIDFNTEQFFKRDIPMDFLEINDSNENSTISLHDF